LPPKKFLGILQFGENYYPSAKKKKFAEGQFFFKQIGIFRKKGFTYEKLSY
jgi:hypothetical protein